MSSQIYSPEEHLDELAKLLVRNYYDVSLYKEIVRNNKKEQEFMHYFKKTFKNVVTDNFFIDDDLDRNRNVEKHAVLRNVVVIGAGASHNNFKDILLATDAIEKIEKNLSKNGNSFLESDKYKQEKARLQAVYYNSNLYDFETRLSLLSHFFTNEQIREQLTEQFTHRYCPCLLYEILAHLFKHRFIDIIINFNFDELLDQAISEEFGKGDYHYIFSDGHCKKSEEIMIENTLRVPIYIKPHGTISHPSSLKFTKDDYFFLPEAMKEQIRTLLNGDNSSHVHGLNLITIGFGMQSIDLNLILESIFKDSTKREKSKIFHFNFEKDEKNYGKSFPKSDKDEIDILVKNKLKQHRVVYADEKNTYGDLFNNLWNKVMSYFKDPYKPRDIWRHKIICDLFHNKNERARFFTDDKQYFELRTYAEILIACAKTKGYIDLKVAVQERIGTYYYAYKKRIEKESSEKRSSEKPIELSKFCENLGLTPDNSIARSLYSFKNRKNLLNSLIKNFIKRLPDSSFVIRPEDQEVHRIKDLIQKIFESKRNDISPKFESRELLHFDSYQKSKILHTNLSISLKFIENLKSDWDLMLLVSERGNFLLEHQNLDKEKNGDIWRGKSIVPIFADFEEDKELTNFLNVNELLIDDEFRNPLIEIDNSGTLIIKEVLDRVKKPNYLPFWYHNHHLILFFKRGTDEEDDNYSYQVKEGKSWDIAGDGIYFFKEGLSNQIKPIYIEKTEKKDLEVLLDWFFLYIFKSRKEPFKNTIGGVLNYGDYSEFQIRKKAILTEYWEKVEAKTK